MTLSSIRNQLLRDIRFYVIDLDPIDTEVLKGLIEEALVRARFDDPNDTMLCEPHKTEQ